MNDTTAKPAPEPIKRSYSDEEVESIYELGRFSAENGDLKRAEVIMRGLVEIAPDYAPAWLGMSFVHAQNHAYENAIQAARRCLKINPAMVEAELFLITFLLSTGDFNSAGTLLGEVGEKIDHGEIDNPNAIRFYRMQLARFESR